MPTKMHKNKMRRRKNYLLRKAKLAMQNNNQTINKMSVLNEELGTENNKQTSNEISVPNEALRSGRKKKKNTKPPKKYCNRNVLPIPGDIENWTNELESSIPCEIVVEIDPETIIDDLPGSTAQMNFGEENLGAPNSHLQNNHEVQNNETLTNTPKHYISKPVFCGDFNVIDMENPDYRLKYWNLTQMVIKNQQEKIHSLEQTNEILRDKVKTLNSLVENLNEKMNKFISAKCYAIINVNKM